MKKVILILIFSLFAISSLFAQVRIKMKLENGVYTTPCIVNGLRLRFIFDTGASNVCISLSEAVFMLKNGYLEESDIHGSSLTQIANGELIENTKINLKEIEISGIKIRNVEALIIHNLSAPLLLGQTAIQKLGKIQIEGDELVIYHQDFLQSNDACKTADSLVIAGSDYWKSKLYNLAINTLQKANYLCSNALDFNSFFILGESYYRIDDYNNCIIWLNKSIKGNFDKEMLSLIHRFLGVSYHNNNDFDNSILNFEKGISLTSDISRRAELNALIGDLYFTNKLYQDSYNYFLKSIVAYIVKYSEKGYDIENGIIKNEIISEIYLRLAASCEYVKPEEYSLYLVKSALCGNDLAIQFCKEKGIEITIDQD